MGVPPSPPPGAAFKLQVKFIWKHSYPPNQKWKFVGHIKSLIHTQNFPCNSVVQDAVDRITWLLAWFGKFQNCEECSENLWQNNVSKIMENYQKILQKTLVLESSETFEIFRNDWELEKLGIFCSCDITFVNSQRIKEIYQCVVFDENTWHGTGLFSFFLL